MEYLKKGDIIRLEKGMKVYAEVPAYISNPSLPFTSQKIYDSIEIGVIYKSNPPTMEKVILSVKNIFLSMGTDNISEEKIKAFIRNLNIDFKPKIFDSSIFEGDYIVDYAHFKNRGSSECWHVVCSKKNLSSMKVEFYQSGPSSLLKLPNIIPIGNVRVIP